MKQFWLLCSTAALIATSHEVFENGRFFGHEQQENWRLQSDQELRVRLEMIRLLGRTAGGPRVEIPTDRKGTSL